MPSVRTVATTPSTVSVVVGSATAGISNGSWQRDFFDFGNVSALFMEMIGNNALSRRGCRGRIQRSISGDPLTGLVSGGHRAGFAVVSPMSVRDSFEALSQRDLAVLVPELLLCGAADRSLGHGASDRRIRTRGYGTGGRRGVGVGQSLVHPPHAEGSRIRGRRRRDDLQRITTRHRRSATVHGLPIPGRRSACTVNSGSTIAEHSWTSSRWAMSS